MVCFGKPEVYGEGKSVRTLKLEKHHIKYNPEEIIWVHSKCHRKIHDVDNPMALWIRYTEKEKKSFYKNNKQDYKTLGTIYKHNL